MRCRGKTPHIAKGPPGLLDGNENVSLVVSPHHQPMKEKLSIEEPLNPKRGSSIGADS